MKKILYALMLLVIVTTIVCCTSSIAKIPVSLPDISGKQDGVYSGESNMKGTPVKVALDVSVKNGQITEININNHSCSPIGKKAEKIIPQIIKQQSLEIDVISGATISSKGIMKAVENALQ